MGGVLFGDPRSVSCSYGKPCSIKLVPGRSLLSSSTVMVQGYAATAATSVFAPSLFGSSSTSCLLFVS